VCSKFKLIINLNFTQTIRCSTELYSSAVKDKSSYRTSLCVYISTHLWVLLHQLLLLLIESFVRTQKFQHQHAAGICTLNSFLPENFLFDLDQQLCSGQSSPTILESHQHPGISYALQLHRKLSIGVPVICGCGIPEK